MAAWRLEETVGWRAFLSFVLAGGLIVFGILGAASVGLFVLPFGMILFGLSIAYAPDTRDRWGVLAGVGAIGVFIGVLNLNYQPCDEGWVTVPPGEDSYSCGGFDGRPILAIGLLLIVVALIMYRRARANAATSDPT
ncbi:MAG: hypothetical protein OER12_01925 [Acidimicrobiia bacterium]|nr:hypothetical protein [Acidimicrobiia bacterium]